jgi:hypothetical protein
MGILGIGCILEPRAIGIGAVPEDASTALIAYLRILGSPFLGIAALNWTARRLAPSPAHRTIILANLVGFGVAGLLVSVAVSRLRPADRRRRDGAGPPVCADQRGEPSEPGPLRVGRGVARRVSPR